MERWELIERYSLLTAAIGFVLWSGWLFLSHHVLGSVAVLLLAFWAVWQALYAERTGGAPPSRLEWTMATAWLWFRRVSLALGGMAFVAGGVAIAMHARGVLDYLVALSLLGVAFLASRTGWIGGSIWHGSYAVEQKVHAARKGRYKWPW